MRLVVVIGVVLALASAAGARKTSSLVDREADSSVKKASPCSHAPYPRGGVVVFYPPEDILFPARVRCDTTKTGGGARIRMRPRDYRTLLEALRHVWRNEKPPRYYRLGKDKTKFEFESLTTHGPHQMPVLELTRPDSSCLFCLTNHEKQINGVCWTMEEEEMSREHGQRQGHRVALSRCLRNEGPPDDPEYLDPETLDDAA